MCVYVCMYSHDVSFSYVYIHIYVCTHAYTVTGFFVWALCCVLFYD